MSLWLGCTIVLIDELKTLESRDAEVSKIHNKLILFCTPNNGCLAQLVGMLTTCIRLAEGLILAVDIFFFK